MSSNQRLPRTVAVALQDRTAFAFVTRCGAEKTSLDVPPLSLPPHFPGMMLASGNTGDAASNRASAFDKNSQNSTTDPTQPPLHQSHEREQNHGNSSQPTHTPPGPRPPPLPRLAVQKSHNNPQSGQQSRGCVGYTRKGEETRAQQMAKREIKKSHDDNTRQQTTSTSISREECRLWI